MYAALFELTSWRGTEKHVFEGVCAAELLAKLEEVQDLGCLIRMGRTMEHSAEGKKALKKLEALCDKAWFGSFTVEDLLTLDVHLEVGTIKCIAVVEGEDAIAQLKASVAKK